MEITTPYSTPQVGDYISVDDDIIGTENFYAYAEGIGSYWFPDGVRFGDRMSLNAASLSERKINSTKGGVSWNEQVVWRNPDGS